MIKVEEMLSPVEVGLTLGLLKSNRSEIDGSMMPSVDAIKRI
jgi:hypothetical protein